VQVVLQSTVIICGCVWHLQDFCSVLLQHVLSLLAYSNHIQIWHIWLCYIEGLMNCQTYMCAPTIHGFQITSNKKQVSVILKLSWLNWEKNLNPDLDLDFSVFNIKNFQLTAFYFYFGQQHAIKIVGNASSTQLV
jgi:hypothetical protein